MDLILFQIFRTRVIKMEVCTWTFRIITVSNDFLAMSMMTVLKKMRSLNKTMLFAIVLVLVSAVDGNVNSSEVSEMSVPKSRMSWLRSLLDHHDWGDYINNSTTLPQQCAVDLRLYLHSLNEGKLWASKSKFLCIFKIFGNVQFLLTNVLVIMCPTIIPITWSQTKAFPVLWKPEQRISPQGTTLNTQTRANFEMYVSQNFPIHRTRDLHMQSPQCLPLNHWCRHNY